MMPPDKTFACLKVQRNDKNKLDETLLLLRQKVTEGLEPIPAVIGQEVGHVSGNP